MKKLIALAFVLALSGCALKPDGGVDWRGSFSLFDSRVKATNLAVAHYAPIVGRDLLLVAGTLVSAECSPALDPATQAASAVLKITAPSSAAAAKAQAALTANAAIAQQLCPLVASIQAAVGPVPAGTPSQTVPAL